MSFYTFCQDNSYKTAMARKNLPAPTQWLIRQGLLPLHGEKSILDYGCGKCHELNNKHFVADGFDPHFRVNGIRQERYDIIICNFVHNVIPNRFERNLVTQRIQHLLKKDGFAYISVRNDVDKLNGLTRKGTWQEYVIVPGTEIRHCPSYRMYLLTKFQ